MKPMNYTANPDPRSPLSLIRGLERDGFLTITDIHECEWTSADECAMAQERSVAGTADEIPTCAVHGSAV